jgi:AcrR family transcriptional regulator
MARRRPSTAVVRRAAGRREEFVTSACALIGQRGYDGVTIKDVADALGVTAPALYRHFPSKHALLAAAISEALAVAEAAAAQAHDSGPSAIIAALAEAAVDQRNLWVLLHRESRHLDHDTRAELVHRYGALVDTVGAAIAAERGRVGGTEAVTLARAVLAALSAPSQYRLNLPKTELTAELSAVANRIVHADLSLPRALPPPTTHLRRPFEPTLDRREEILAAAAAQFAGRGFHAVTMEEIGAAVSMAGPSIYNHFGAKAELLAAILWRLIDWIDADMTRAVAGHDTVTDALLQLYRDYGEVAAQHPELFDVFTVEGVNLPAGEKRRIGAAHDAFVARWAALLRRAHPRLSAGAARVQVCASLAVVNELGTSTGADRGGADTRAVSLALAAVGL